MTLEQKVGQMVQADIRSVTPDDVRKFRLGSVLNGGGAFPGENKHASVADWVALADGFYDASMDTANGGLAIPIMWGTDAVHGHNNVIGATLFPHNIGLGAAHDPDLMERIGAATAREVAVTGLDWTFAPLVAVVRDDRWGRTYESYSEDPEIVRAYAERMVRGLQGTPGSKTFLDTSHVLATAKHFIGDGGTADGVDRGDNLSSEADLLKIHAPGYIAAMNAGVQTIMASYNSWQGFKMHGLRYLLTDVLKQRMGFDGIVVSDWDGVDEVQGCSKDKCAQAINAGIDMVMVPTDWKNFIGNTLDQVRAEKIPLSRIDDAVTRILRVKFRAGLFEKGKPSSRPLANKRELLGAPEHRELARQAVRESLVLLKNERGLLPLRRNSRVAVLGDGADNIPKQTGGWTVSWQGTGNSNADFPGRDLHFPGRRAHGGGGGRQSELERRRPAAGASGRCHRGIRRRPLCRMVRRPAVARLSWRRRRRARFAAATAPGIGAERLRVSHRPAVVGRAGARRVRRVRRGMAAGQRGRRRRRRAVPQGRRQRELQLRRQAVVLVAACGVADCAQPPRREIRPAVPLRLRPAVLMRY